ncbi:acyl carrier protein [Terribacillus sp. JSM ZJ617]|uniref:acyl carrier protein n=1 Tax=Terribacillus sp. JSM ZJ617 TaxID=3342119 RepID=UPI0035A9A3C4
MTLDEFMKLISNIANIPVERIVPESTFKDDLGIDSLNMVNLFVQIGEDTGIGFNKFIIAENLLTVAGAYEILEKEYTA